MRTLYMVAVMLALVAATQADLIVNATPQDIPDNNALGIQQTIEVSGYTSNVQSVSVNLQISGRDGGAFNGDFFVSLQHESGYAVLLNSVGQTSSNPFGYGDNGFNVTLSASGSDIHLYQAVAYTLGLSGELTGTWSPDGRVVDPLLVTDADARTATLSSFQELDPNGTWTLFVADTSANGNGRLDAWAVDVVVVPEPSSVLLLALGLTALVVRCRRVVSV